MFRSTLFWCLSFLCVLGLESTIIWQEINQKERPLITDCIINSNRIETIPPTLIDVTNNPSTHSSKKMGNKTQRPTHTDLNKPPRIIPLCQIIIESAPTCRVIVASYEAMGITSHFFAALVLDGDLGHVTRLGSIWTTVDRKRVPVKKIEAKSQAERYYLWTPYLCKESWQEVQHAEIVNVKNVDYKLKWIWSVVKDNMVGIYSGPTKAPEQVPNYIFAIGKQLNTANAKLVEVSEPASLAAVEAGVEEALSSVHPFLSKEWLSIDQIATQLDQYSTALDNLTKLAADETNVDASKMLLHGAKVVTTCEGLICVFKVQPGSDQESYYVLAGGLIGIRSRYEMTMYINIGNAEGLIEKCDIHVKNHYTMAFSPSILPTSLACSWPWAETRSLGYIVPCETLGNVIAQKALFSIILEEMYVQKIYTNAYGHNYAGIAVYVIYGYKGRFFTAAHRIWSGRKLTTVHVSGLMFAEQLEKDISQTHKELFMETRSDIPGDIDFGKVFPKIQIELPNITGWEKSQILDVSKNWISEHERVAAPITPRNAHALTQWYFLLFKITVKDTAALEDMGLLSYKFFSVVVVNKGEDVIIVEAHGRKAWFRTVIAKLMFQEFLKNQHTNLEQ